MATNELAKLVSSVELQAATDGACDTAVAALRLSRFSAPSGFVALLDEPSLCVVAQGAKEVLLADQTRPLEPAQSVLVSVDLPVDAQVVEASPGRPYLAVRIWLDPAVVGELLADGMTAPLARLPGGEGLRCGRTAVARTSDTRMALRFPERRSASPG